MGGILTDVHGRTTLPGLYAAGEAACTGVHGANRLASNSLLEGLVFGALAADAMVADTAGQPNAAAPVSKPPAPIEGNTPDADTERWIEDLRSNMWLYAGLLRDAEGLETMQHKLHTVASIIVASALARHESRGAHYRNDYPQHDPIASHSIMRSGKLTLEPQPSSHASA
jgi:L-aspartate oxidase